jgi:hypothetical protein
MLTPFLWGRPFGRQPLAQTSAVATFCPRRSRLEPRLAHLSLSFQMVTPPSAKIAFGHNRTDTPLCADFYLRPYRDRYAALQSLLHPPTYGGWDTSPPTYENGVFTPLIFLKGTNHPLKQFWKIIVNHKKIIKWKSNCVGFQISSST